MDDRRLRFLNILDEDTRSCPAISVGRRSKAVDVIAAIEELFGQYPVPTHLRRDSGPEFIAHALQEWCTGAGSGAALRSPWARPCRCIRRIIQLSIRG